ncbi:MAG: AAA family ATPase [Microthrixaceae bacterium]|nr:AAA family ATPase [Microthrixaceae bacterium]
MTITDTDDLPDDILEDQAAAEGLTARPSRTRQDVPHDTDAEIGVLGVMLYSMTAAETVLGLGLEPEHFYAPRHQAIYTAICETVAAGEQPDPVTVPPRGNGSFDGRDLLSIVTHAPLSTSAPAYTRRIIHTARLRALLSGALEAANSARNGDLDTSLAQLQRLAAAQPADDAGTTWTPVDLAAVIDGDGPPEPTMLARDDGHQLLYAGRVHAFNAESESGKSWLACAAAAERLTEGEHVIYLDFEDHATGIVGRLRALGVDRDAIIGRLHYVRPDDPIDPVAIAALERLLIDHQPTLAIVDGVTEVMVQNGWSINDNDDAAKFLLALPDGSPVTDAPSCSSTTCPKTRRPEAGTASGPNTSWPGWMGLCTAWRSPNRSGSAAPAPAGSPSPRTGQATSVASLLAVRRVGTLQLTSRADGDVSLAILCPESDTPIRTRPTTLMEQVAAAIQTLNDSGVYPTRNGILADVSGKKKWVAEALRLLIEEGHVTTRPGPNRSQLHTLTKPYVVPQSPRSDLTEEF